MRPTMANNTDLVRISPFLFSFINAYSCGSGHNVDSTNGSSGNNVDSSSSSNNVYSSISGNNVDSGSSGNNVYSGSGRRNDGNRFQ
jgi:hypothetical protein